MSTFLDKTGLSYFWAKIKAYVDGKIQIPWPVNLGGTGATTAASALSNLGAAETPEYVLISLTPSKWMDDNTQGCTVLGVSSDETKQLIQIVPKLSSLTAFMDAGIVCTTQSFNRLVFSCSTIPTTTIDIFVVIQTVKES